MRDLNKMNKFTMKDYRGHREKLFYIKISLVNLNKMIFLKEEL